MKKLRIGYKYSLSLLVLFLASFSGFARYTPNANTIYNFFKSQMNMPPQTVPDETLIMGTFNQATGEFTGIGAQFANIPNGHGGTIRTYPVISSKGVKTHLQFNLSSNTYTTLSINGVQYNNGGQNYIIADLTVLGLKDFQIAAGAKNFSNKLNLRTFAINAMGAFTLAEVPLGIIYIPPGAPGSQNYAFYSTQQSVETTLSMSASSSSSLTTSGMDEISGIITKGKELASAIGGVNGSILGTGLAGLPTENITQTVGHTVTDGYDISYATISGQSISTAGNLPGEGDIFLYITNVRFIFIIKDNVLTVSLLDFAEHYQFSAKWLRDHEQDRYSRLKLLDPFTNTAVPNLVSNPRFTQYDGSPLNLSPGQVNITTEQEIASSSVSHSQLNYSTTVTDHHAGWLSSLLYNDADFTKTVTLSQSNSTQTTQTQQQASAVSILCPQNAANRYGIYLDNLFKTIAVVDNPWSINALPTLSGVFYDAKTKVPVGNQLVYVIVAGKKITAKTDNAGRYKYYDPELAGFKGSPMALKQVTANTRAYSSSN